MMLWNADCGGGGIFSSPCIFPDNDDMEVKIFNHLNVRGNGIELYIKL